MREETEKGWQESEKREGKKKREESNEEGRQAAREGGGLWIQTQNRIPPPGH